MCDSYWHDTVLPQLLNPNKEKFWVAEPTPHTIRRKALIKIFYHGLPKPKKMGRPIVDDKEKLHQERLKLIREAEYLIGRYNEGEWI